ncbi:replication-associated recombination protein A [Litoribrevibacter albus]|uniref:Replication-associated recombination protein A n=1 Tax=Litoribrevibacter albus TaxID=1473156 RepID=A0AA37W7X9_9GAMM|nr:replication-associated recombination protein A [Litoribrevibacter albus]GLQ31709.1 recombination factor protein RarA [Litoribrevibacter albus]
MSNDLFSNEEQQAKARFQPLAARCRPTTLSGYIGQQHLLGEGKPLRKAIEANQLHSMLLWGPPGVGKTTLARIIAHSCNAEVIEISAVMSGVKDIRAAVDQAKMHLSQGRRTLVFVDEVHRFNKTQQDAFLPYVEDGTLVFVGATTENPSFEVNNALLSRARVYKLQSLNDDEIEQLLRVALSSDDELLSQGVSVDPDALSLLAATAMGDARRAYNLLEVSIQIAQADSQTEGSLLIDLIIAGQALANETKRFDKQGDAFYDQISALHKSVRGSSVDGALYWFCRMLDGGCDPLYIARRVVRMASEEVGNADPRALEVSLNAWQVQERLGSPEGELAVAQAICYIAAAPKSNAVYTAYNRMRAIVAETKDYEVPMHIRNAPTELMKEHGFGDGYRYAHDEPNAYAAGENYFPEALKDIKVYQPVDRGLEKKISEKLEWLKQLDDQSDHKRYD